jgi:hypothetical protein
MAALGPAERPAQDEEATPRLVVIFEAGTKNEEGSFFPQTLAVVKMN